MRQDGHPMLLGPGAQTSAGHVGQMLHDRGTEDLEEEVLVGLAFLPQPPRFLLEFRTGPGRHQNRAMGPRLFERPLQPFAVESHALDSNGIARDLDPFGFARVDPGTPVIGVPRACPIGQFACALRELVIRRITQQPPVFGRLDTDIGSGISQFDHPATWCMDSMGLNWQPSTKKSKKSGCVSNRQCSTLLTRASSSRRLEQDSKAIDAPSMAALPTCTTREGGRWGMGPMPRAASTFMCRPNPPAR